MEITHDHELMTKLILESIENTLKTPAWLQTFL